jgi:hypothetical protein
VTRGCAAWLVLVVVPFTAPFATLDLPGLLTKGQTDTATSVVDGLVTTNVQDDDADDAAASHACIQQTHAPRLGEIIPLISSVVGAPRRSTRTTLNQLDPTLAAPGAAALLTVLRL